MSHARRSRGVQDETAERRREDTGMAESGKEAEVVSKLATDYIIDNVIHTSVRVVEKKK